MATLDLTPADTKKVIELLRACDKALGSCEEKAQKQGEVIKSQDALISAQSARIVQLEDKESSILRSPVLWFAAGVVATVLTALAINNGR